MQLSNLPNWLLFTFFVVGSMGGIVYFIRLMFWYEKRVEVHHRYMQVPVFYGYDNAGQPGQPGMPGRPGDMAQHDEAEPQPAE